MLSGKLKQAYIQRRFLNVEFWFLKSVLILLFVIILLHMYIYTI